MSADLARLAGQNEVWEFCDEEQPSLHASNTLLHAQLNNTSTLPVVPPSLQVRQDSISDDTAAWLRWARIVLPHVCILLICALYVLLGALVFYAIEQPYERHQRAERLSAINGSRSEIMNILWEAVHVHAYAEHQWTIEANFLLDNFTQILFYAFDDRYVTVDDLHANASLTKEANLKWSFPAAIFFSVSTLATIGYGNNVPQTTVGRIICILFGLFGIPIMLVTIADMGKFISDGLMYSFALYKRMTAKWKLRSLASKKSFPHAQDKTAQLVEQALQTSDEVHIPVTLILIIVVGYNALGGLILSMYESKWSFFDAFYYSFITMTTVGFGDYVPQSQSFYPITIIYIFLGLAITTMCVDLAGSQYIKKIHYMGRKIQDAREKLRTMGEVMRYAAFLRRKYGLTDEQLQMMTLCPQEADWQEFQRNQLAFVPADIHRFRFIDQLTDSTLRSSIRISSSYSQSASFKTLRKQSHIS